MEETGKEQLETIDRALGFLLLVIGAVLLSFWATAEQRRALCCAIEGRESAAAALIYPLRHTGNAVLVGSLGFFLCLAKSALDDAGRDGGDTASQQANFYAAALVFAAAAIRFRDVEEQHRKGAL